MFPNIEQNKKTPSDTKWSFHFKTLYAIVILTFLTSIFALIYDELSSTIKRVTNDYTKARCKVEGRCGWSEGVYSYSASNGEYSISNCPPDQLWGKSEYTVNYRDYCNDVRGDEYYDGQYDDACIAMDAGNVWLAFSIISLSSQLGLLIIFTSACIKKDVVVNEKIQKNVRIILIILFLITWVSEFVAAFVWLMESICDEANVFYELIAEDIENYFGMLSIFVLPFLVYQKKSKVLRIFLKFWTRCVV